MSEDKKNELQSYSPHGLISQALAQGVPIETLERLMDLQERYQAGQAKAAFFDAFSKFQGICPDIMKTKKVDFPSKSGGSNVKYSYTPLATIRKEIQPALTECSLSYRWEFEELPAKIKCICIVSHVGGHSERTTMEAGKDTTGNKNDIQSIGSARSYLQRYTLIGALGLTTGDEDNDGRTAKAGAGIPAPISKTDPIVAKIKAAKTKRELDALWPTLTENQQPDYLGYFQERAAEFKKK